MKNLLKFLGIAALVAAIGFSMTGCKTEADGGDPALKGSWTTTYNYDPYVIVETYTFSGANVEYIEDRMSGSTSGATTYTSGKKGTYTVSGNTMTITWTHKLNGGVWVALNIISTRDVPVGIKSNISYDVTAGIEEPYTTETFTYTVSGYTLFLTRNGTTRNYTKL